MDMRRVKIQPTKTRIILSRWRFWWNMIALGAVHLDSTISFMDTSSKNQNDWLNMWQILLQQWEKVRDTHFISIMAS